MRLLIALVLCLGCKPSQPPRIDIYDIRLAEAAFAVARVQTDSDAGKPTPAPIDDDCPQCYGTGKTGDGIATCTACNGTGKRTTQYNEVFDPISIVVEAIHEASASSDGVTEEAEAGTETAAGGSTGEGIPQDSSAATSQDSPSEQSTIDDQSKGGADLPVTEAHTSTEDDTVLGAEKKNDALSPQSAATEGEFDPCQPAPFEEVQRPMLFVRVGPNCPGCENFKRDLSRDVIGLAELIGSRAQIVEVPAQPGQPRPAFKLAGGQWLIGYYGPRELKTWFERELERMNR